jgi:uncharacterized protein
MNAMREVVSTEYYLLFYEVVQNYVALRQPFREEHLGLADAARARGELMLGGALSDPVDGALLLFNGGPEVAEAFARNDPYVIHGLVTRWYVRKWTVVAGSLAPTISTQPVDKSV